MISLSILLGFFLMRRNNHMTENSTKYILSVSKSLLIVLGTSPKSALFFGYGKCHPVENRSEFTTGFGQQKRVAHTSHSPYRGASLFLSKMRLDARKAQEWCAFLACLIYRVARLTPSSPRRCSSHPLRSGVRWLKA